MDCDPHDRSRKWRRMRPIVPLRYALRNPRGAPRWLSAEQPARRRSHIMMASSRRRVRAGPVSCKAASTCPSRCAMRSAKSHSRSAAVFTASCWRESDWPSTNGGKKSNRDPFRRRLPEEEGGLRYSQTRIAPQAHAILRYRALLGAMAVVAIIGLPDFGWARGGYTPKPPRPFTQEELILIGRCRVLTRSVGRESALFMRQCSTVRPYINH
jgi:hypothetical protein